MKIIKGKLRISFLSLALFGIIICGMLSTTVSASLSYQTTLVKGTEVFTVKQYDDEAWKSIVNNSTTPSVWFEGEINITGANNKITLKGWIDTTWETFDVLTTILMPQFFTFTEMMYLLILMNNFGYNETTINANYTNSYKLTYGVRAVWNFTTSDFQEDPSYTDGILVFKNPLDFKSIIDDYNNLAVDLNGKLNFSPYSFPNLTADEFLWQLALNGLAVAKPQSEYLVNLIDELECENASSSGKTLIFERFGETDYTVEISYGEKGTMSSLSVKDIEGEIIFQLVSTNSEWIFYTIFTVILISIAGITVVLILRKRKINKLRKN